MTADLIGLTVPRAVEKLKALGYEYEIIENCDSLDDADTNLVSAARDTDGVITLITSRFKRDIK